MAEMTEMTEMAEIKWPQTRLDPAQFSLGLYDLSCYRHAASRSDSYRKQVLCHPPNLQRAKELASHSLVTCPDFQAAVRTYLRSVI